MSTRTAVVGFLLALVMVLTVWMLYASGPARPDPLPSPVPLPSVTPASPAIVHAALRARHLARSARSRVAFADRCLGLRGPLALKASPARSCGDIEWQAARAAWQAQRKAFNRRTAHLLHLMRNPGGSGAARWWPLCLWTGWEPSLKSWFIAIATRESHGQPHAQNPAHPYCYGILQLAREHWAK